MKMSLTEAKSCFPKAKKVMEIKQSNEQRINLKSKLSWIINLNRKTVRSGRCISIYDLFPPYNSVHLSFLRSATNAALSNIFWSFILSK